MFSSKLPVKLGNRSLNDLSQSSSNGKLRNAGPGGLRKLFSPKPGGHSLYLFYACTYLRGARQRSIFSRFGRAMMA